MNFIQPQVEISPHPSGPASDLGSQLRAAWRVFWRGRYLLLSCWLLMLVPTILYLVEARPLYTASIKIVVEGTEAGAVTNNGDNAFLRNELSEFNIVTEAEVLTSISLARRVVDKLHLADDPEFNSSLRSPSMMAQILPWLNPMSWLSLVQPADTDSRSLPDAAVEDMSKDGVVKTLLGKIRVEPVRRSYILTVSVSAEGREKAARIANTLGSLYLTDRLEASLDEAKQVNGWLAERLEGLRRDVAASEAAVEKFRAANNLRNEAGTKGTVSDQQLAELNSRLVLARTNLAEKQAQLEQIKALMRSQGSVESATGVLSSPLIQNLREQEATVLRSLSEASKTYGDRHPRILAYKAELNELRTKIASEVEKISASVANDVEVATTGVRTLEREVDQLRQRSDVAGEAELRLRELERQAEAGRTLYEAFLAKFKREADADRLQRANARIISPATLPFGPSWPNWQATLFAVSVAALAIGTALIFLLHHFDPVVRSSDEAEELTGLTTLAVVPLHRRSSEGRLVEELIDRPRSALVDAIRSLRITMDAARDGRRGQVVVLSSSVPREGKSFVSLCLATVFARTEGRTLLIDGDLHKPTLNGMLGLSREKGLAHLLEGTATLEEVLVPGIVHNLDFLPGGMVSRAGDLVTSAGLTALLETLTPIYDRIVIDSPPVLAVSDARLLARVADRLIYLVRWNSTPREAVRNGLKLLGEAQVPVDGIVLSQVDQRKHSIYAYGDYGHYYGRYREYYGD